MSDVKKLDIMVELGLITPDIRIGVDQTIPDIKIKMESGGEALPTYIGETSVTPLAWQTQILETANKTLRDNITILEIPYSSVSNPQDGRTVYIGE